MIRVLLACVFLLAAIPAEAQQCYPYCPPRYTPAPPPTAYAPRVGVPKAGKLKQAQLHDAIVKVRAGTTVSSNGTGTVIGQTEEHSYVVTCWHLLRDGEWPIYVRTNDGKNYVADIVKQDSQNDFLLLRCPNTGIAPVKYSEDQSAVKVSDKVTMYGFSAQHGFVQSTGYVVKFVSFGGGNTCMETTCATDQGMSGGPIIINGCVVGTITGNYDSGHAVGPCFPRLRMALRRLLPPYRRPQQIVVVNPPQQQQTPPEQDQGSTQQPGLPTPADPDTEPGKDPDSLLISLDEIVKRMDGNNKDIMQQIRRVNLELARVENTLDDMKQSGSDAAGPQGEPGPQGPAGPAGPRGPKGDAYKPSEEDIQNIVSGVVAALKADEDFADSIRPEPPEIDIEGLNDAAVANFASQVWLYYTSASAPQLVEIDEKIQALREKGYPIIVTYLTPQQSTVMGVPMIFVPSTGKKVVGINNCTQFLAMQIPR